jgi:hypothetical protein
VNADTSRLRIVTFGDVAQGFWGAACAGAVSGLALGSPSHADAKDAVTIEDVDWSGQWRLQTEGVDLRLRDQDQPADQPVEATSDRLVSVSGTVVMPDGEREVDCLGRRGERPWPPLERFAAVRDVSAWFEGGEGVALSATRPAGPAGHDADATDATLFEAGVAVPVADPRLSTTYSSEHVPWRLGLELRLQGGEEDEPEQYPRRIAGESMGPGARWKAGELALWAGGFRCVSGGRAGTGVYVLAST